MIHIQISIAEQILTVIERAVPIARYPVSTGANGAGQMMGSGKTPLGQHIIRAKIGAGALENSVFVGRRQTGEICTRALFDAMPGRDWILTRILWLSGMEPGFNRLGDVDTMRRYIYIHGTPDWTPLGSPGSKGCVRMRNRDIIALFDRVEPGCSVVIAR